MKILPKLLTATCLIGSGMGVPVLTSGATATIDFQKEVRPLFESRCYECHGPKKQKSGLRLDRKSSVFQGGDSGKPAVVPGKSAESLLAQKITSKDPDEIMPPKGEKLTTAETELLKKWIDQGATWIESDSKPKHWAYIPPARSDLPRVKNKRWCRNGIDYFVLSRLQQEKLPPAPE